MVLHKIAIERGVFMEVMSNFSAQPMSLGLPMSKLYLEDGIGFVELLECFGTDLTVANAARVSMHKESLFDEIKEDDGSVHYQLSERDKQLIHYLAKNKHITPFFHPQLRFRLKMPIFVVREWYRHTIGFARNEVSRRYVTEEPQFMAPMHLRQRDKNIKQGSKNEAIENNDVVAKQMRDFMQNACAYYQQLLDMGVCPEQARMVLPQSMYTEFIETASLAGYARLAVLRLDTSAQKEIREYASRVSSMLEKVFPVSWAALIDAGKGSLL
jgi:thymidylate synthase (FAD)